MSGDAAAGQQPVDRSFLASGGGTAEMIASWTGRPPPGADLVGPEFVVIYNDAWVPILRPAKHPALGKPGELVWLEMWHIIGAAALAGRPGRWVLPMRHGVDRRRIWLSKSHHLAPAAIAEAAGRATTGRWSR